MRKQIIFAIFAIAHFTSAHALTNEQFATEVQRQIQLLKKDDKALKSASEFCSLLSSDRRRNEPRCIAAERVGLLNMTRPSTIRIR
jgi:hypothetical protein